MKLPAFLPIPTLRVDTKIPHVTTATTMCGALTQQFHSYYPHTTWKHLPPTVPYLHMSLVSELDSMPDTKPQSSSKKQEQHSHREYSDAISASNACHISAHTRTMSAKAAPIRNKCSTSSSPVRAGARVYNIHICACGTVRGARAPRSACTAPTPR
jgi:hypothetical protein